MERGRRPWKGKAALQRSSAETPVNASGEGCRAAFRAFSFDLFDGLLKVIGRFDYIKAEPLLILLRLSTASRPQSLTCKTYFNI